MSIESATVRQQRSLGLFPSSCLEKDPLWALEYRVSDLLASETPPAGGSIASTIQQAEQLLGSTEEKDVIKSIYASLLLLNGENTRVLEALDGVSVHPDGYGLALSLKNAYLRSMAHKNLNATDAQEQEILKGLDSGFTPSLSDVEARFWMDKLFAELVQFIPEVNITKLGLLFRKNECMIWEFVTYLTAHGTILSKELIADLNEFAQKRSAVLLKGSKFPHSEEKNNVHLEEFLQRVTLSPVIPWPVKRSLIEQGIAKTYQSKALIHSLTEVLLALGTNDEVKQSFAVFENYIHSELVLDGRHSDIISVIGLFRDHLNWRFQRKDVLSTEDFAYYKSLISRFTDLLSKFQSDNLLNLTLSSELLDQTSTQFSSISPPLKVVLSSAFFALGNAQLALLQSPYTTLSKSDSEIDSLLQWLHTALVLNPLPEVWYKNAFVLALLRRIKMSVKILKHFLKTLSGKNMIFFQAWHLLALLLSVEENKEESFKVICFVVNEMDECLVQPGFKCPSVLKGVFIQIKITQLAIIEALFGVEQALDSLPELFTLYSVLFSDVLIGENVAEVKNEKPQSNTLSKIKTIRSIKPQKKSEANPAMQNNSPYKFRPGSYQEQRILQQLWIVSSAIYSRANMVSEAEQALLDAENTYHPTADTHTALAMMLTPVNPVLALAEFEKALLLDRAHLGATIGLGNLMLSENLESQLFIDEKDKLAGIARIKLLLETIVERMDGNYRSEVWWLLSLIYERFQDRSRLKASLWRSVELEEGRPVRDVSTIEGSL